MMQAMPCGCIIEPTWTRIRGVPLLNSVIIIEACDQHRPPLTGLSLKINDTPPPADANP